MDLTILHFPEMERPYLIRRENASYEQHAHCHTRRDCERIRQLIDANRYPYSQEYRIAMQRLLTEEEFKQLRKRDRYHNKPISRI